MILGVLRACRRRLINFLYNLDRAIASLAGAPPQETISSEIGRHEQAARAVALVKLAGAVLDDVQKLHCENAVLHANALDKADDGFVG